MQKLRFLNSSHIRLYAPVVIAQGSFVQLGPISRPRSNTVAPFRLRKKASTPANDIAERLALYSSGTIFLRGTITFPSSALINLGTVKAGRRIYDLITKGKTNLSTTRIKELITRSRTRQGNGEKRKCRTTPTTSATPMQSTNR